jgi:hypothetical protein
LFVTPTPSTIDAQEGPIKGKPALPGEECQTNPRKTWTPQEKWVWEQICRGKIADFNKAKGYGGKLDPKKDKEWPKNRILRPAFLETILLHEPYRGALTHHGVRIFGAWFKEPLDLSNATLLHQLLLHFSRFESHVNLRRMKTLHLLSLIGSTFNGKLNMNGIQAEGSLFMRGGAEFAEVDLISARIGGSVSMTASKFTGKVNMNSMQAGSLYMRGGAEFAEVELISARIGGPVDMTGSKFTGKVNMNNMQAGGSLYMRGGAEFAEVELIIAKIRGQVDMDGSKFTGKVNMNSMQAGDLFMEEGAEFAEPVILAYMKIGGNLELSGSKFASIDLTSTQVKGEFALGPPTAKWSKGAKLTLRNTEVGALQDSPDAWPDWVEFDGFTYALLGGDTPDEPQDMAARGISELKQWLGKQERYSPQPYEQLAKVLQKQGRPDKADDVLYAGKNRELSETSGLLHWLGLVLLKIFIGYGYRIHYAIYWFLGFVGLGVFVLRISGQGPTHRMPYGITYSLDMLLPIIRLRQRHYDIDLTGWARYYFYLHILMGYVLGSFLVAGLSGLTK